MHQQIRNGQFAPWLKFFLQCGNLDEIKDRNHNGIIDSIEDTLDLVKELENKGSVSYTHLFILCVQVLSLFDLRL